MGSSSTEKEQNFGRFSSFQDNHMIDTFPFLLFPTTINTSNFFYDNLNTSFPGSPESDNPVIIIARELLKLSVIGSVRVTF